MQPKKYKVYINMKFSCCQLECAEEGLKYHLVISIKAWSVIVGKLYNLVYTFNN